MSMSIFIQGSIDYSTINHADAADALHLSSGINQKVKSSSK